MWYLFSKSVTIYHLPVYQTWPSELSLYGLNSRAAHPYPTPLPNGPHSHYYHGSMTCEKQQNRPLNHITPSCTHQRQTRLSYPSGVPPLPMPSPWSLPWPVKDVTPTCHATWRSRIPQKSPHGEAFDLFVVCRKFWPLIGRWWLKTHLPSLWTQKEFYVLCPGGHGTYFNADWSSRCEDVQCLWRCFQLLFWCNFQGLRHPSNQITGYFLIACFPRLRVLAKNKKMH